MPPKKKDPTAPSIPRPGTAPDLVMTRKGGIVADAKLKKDAAHVKSYTLEFAKEQPGTVAGAWRRVI